MRRVALALTAALVVVPGLAWSLTSTPTPATADAPTPPRPDELTAFDFLLLGLSLRPEPQAQVVPRNTATGIQLAMDFSEVSADAVGLLALFPGQLEVAAELTGPGLAPTPLRGPPAELLPIPPLVERGIYTVRDLRLEMEVCQGAPPACHMEVLLRATPDTATVEVIDRVLITQVTTRPLTAEEIRQKGILFGDDSFQGFNFTLALQLESRPVTIDLPVLFDSQNVPIPLRPTSSIDISGPGLPTLRNASVVPVMMGPDLKSVKPELLPQIPPDIRIPGLLVIPGDVGFLNQFFSALLLVTNGAPEGSGLAVRQLSATIALPPGADGDFSDTRDNPLRLAPTEDDPNPSFDRPVLGPGPDGAAGTTDDTDSFAPAEQGQAEFLLEGLLEGFHEISFDIQGTLDGLPVGSIPIKGQARGGVLVRNPTFQLTFSAPATIRQGEEFTLYITINNTSDAPANFVNVNLPPTELIGAQLAPGEVARKEIEEIPPRDSCVLSYRFTSERTGRVTASYLKVDGADGALLFHLGVDERGVPLSPDTIVLPSSVNALKAPGDASSQVVSAALRVLGQAWSVATAPEGTLPEDVTRVSRSTVLDRATELGEAGFRVQVGESVERALVGLLMSWLGGSDPGFEEILRETEAGAELMAAVGATLDRVPSVPKDVAAFQETLADGFSSSPPHMVVGMGTDAGASPVAWQMADPTGRAISADATGGDRSLPNAAYIPLTGQQGNGLMLLPRLGSSLYELRFAPTRTDIFDFSVTLPLPDGSLGLYRFQGVNVDPGLTGRLELDVLGLGDTLTLSLERDGVLEASVASAPVEVFTSGGPRLLASSVIGPETLTGADPWGRVVALVFDRELRSTEADLETSYSVEANEVVSATRQLSGRLVFLFLRDPVHNFIPRTVRVSGLFDVTGRPMVPASVSEVLSSRLTDPGAVVTGHVTDATGAPVPGAQILYRNGSPSIGITAKTVAPDGTYGIDYVRKDGNAPFFVRATDPQTGGTQELMTRVRTNGEHIVMDLVLFGRGGVQGVVKDLDGNPVAGARVLVKSQADPTSAVQTETDGEGRYEAAGLLVGPVSVKAVSGAAVGTASGSIQRAGTTASIDVAINLTQAGGSVSGNVFEIDAAGASHPLEGVEVYFAIPRPGATGDIAVDDTLTDANGDFSFTGMPAGEFRIVAVDRVRLREVFSPVSTLLAGAEHPPVTLVFTDEREIGAIEGTVREENRGLAGVFVQGAGRRVETDANGFYSIPDAAPGTYTLTAWDATRSARRSVTVRAGQTALADFFLAGRGTVRVQVLDPQGQPLTDFPVFRVLGGSACSGLQALTDPVTGVAEFTDVAVGTASFKAFVNGDVAKGSTAIQHSGQIVDLVLRFAGLGRVVGTVTDPDGNAVFGADVTLKSRRYSRELCDLVLDPKARQVRTGPDGTFVFDGVPIGDVSATATHFAQPTPATARDVLLADGDERRLDLQFTAEAPGQITGTVFLPDGKTPAGAGVLVSTASSTGGDLTVTTETDGTFAFAPILKPGRYELTATDPATGKKARRIVYLGQNQDVTAELRLLGQGTVGVEVRDGGDQLVDEALVELRRSSFPFDEKAVPLLPQDEGVARFERVSEGRFTVTVTDTNGLGGRASGILTGDGDTVRVTVRLTITGKVRGVYRTGGTDPLGIPNAEVRLRQGLSGRLLGSTTSSATPVSVDGCDFGPGGAIGVFAFDQVPAGTVLVTATDPLTGRIGEASGKIVEQDQVVCLEVTRLGEGTIAGRVVDDQANALGGANVELRSSTGLSSLPNFEASATTDGEGAFRFEGVPLGSFTLKATFPRLLVSGTASGALEHDGQKITDIEVVLEPSVTLAGTVLDADGTTPVAGASLALKPKKGTLSGVSDAEGHFAFQFVPVGEFTLTAEEAGGGGDAGILTGTLEAGVDLLDARVVFNGTGTVSGTAYRSDGQTLLTAAESAKVTLSRPKPFARHLTTAVGPDGTFRLFDVPVGDYSLSLTAKVAPFKGAATGHIEFDGATDDVTIQLEESRSVIGRVLSPDDAPVPNVQVTLKDAKVTLSELTGPDGAFRIEGVPLGDFTLRAQDPITGGLAVAAGAIDASSPPDVDVGDLILDTEPIAVSSISPPDGATGVSPESAIVVGFTDPVAPESLPGRYHVTADGVAFSMKRELSTDGLTLTFTPTDVLPPNAAIEVFISKDLKDTLGRRLGENFVATFTTAGAIVIGTVTSGDAPVAGAEVSLAAAATTLTTTTDPAGAYRFDNLPFKKGSTEPVVVEARDPATLFRGRRASSFRTSGRIRLDIALAPVGAVSGTVFRSDGVTPVAGAEVSINRSLSGLPTKTVTNNNGAYAFDFVPLGSFTIDVTDPATGDRGRGQGAISAAGGTVLVNVRMNGVGAVEVSVVDADGQPVAGAQVDLTTPSPFFDIQHGVTDASGLVTFDHVLAGAFTVSAHDPVTRLNGKSNGTAIDSQTVQVTVELQPSATLRGQILTADGLSPIEGASVQIYGAPSRQATSEADGSYLFETLPLGTYRLEVRVAGRLRARVRGIELATNGEERVVDVRLVGTGVVMGQVVRDADGSPVADAPVSLRSANADIGGFFQTRSDATGGYRVEDVPLGGFTVSVDLRAEKLRGETTGTLSEDGEEVVADVRLLSNATDLPVLRYDANSNRYQVLDDGSIGASTNGVFDRNWTAHRAGFVLEVIEADTAYPYQGGSFGTVEEAGREIVTASESLAGLEVFRKVFVPQEGYFARFLEVLHNPTDTPITVDVRISTSFSTYSYGYVSPRVRETSSGDAVLDVTDPATADQWAVVDDSTDADPFENFRQNLPAVALAFDGPGAPLRVAETGFSTGSRYWQLFYRWNGVSVAPGETVVLMHFGSQQLSRSAARAAAERLTGLAPEAMAGLSAEELAQVRNFVLPADGTSDLAALPPLDGTVTGDLLAGDGSTPVAGVEVRFKSAHVLFGRTLRVTSNTEGSFTFKALFTDNSSKAVPVDDFTLSATDPVTSIDVQSPGAFTGSFTGNLSLGSEASASSHLSASNTPDKAADGDLSTVWKPTPSDPDDTIEMALPPGVTVAGVGLRGQSGNYFQQGTFELFDAAGGLLESFGITQDLPSPGSVDFPVSPPLSDVARVRFMGARGKTNTPGVAELMVLGSGPVEGLTRQDVVLPGLGIVEGRVLYADGTPAEGSSVEIRSAEFTDQTTTSDATGHFAFENIPAGHVFELQARHPSLGFTTTMGALILQGHGDRLSVDLVLPAVATIQVTVLKADGVTPFDGVNVTLRGGFGTYRSGNTDAQGIAVLDNVPEGDFTVSASYAGTRFDEGAGTVTHSDHGSLIQLTLVEIPSGNVEGTVFAVDGETPLSWTRVEIFSITDGRRLDWDYTDDAGFYRFTAIRPDRAGFRVVATEGGVSGESTGAFTTDGETVTVNVILPISVVKGHISYSDGSPVPQASVFITQPIPDGGEQTFYGDTFPDGRYWVTGVDVGDFKLTAQDDDSGLYAVVDGRVDDIQVPVTLDVTLPPSGTVTGTVFDADGAGFPSAVVGLVSEGLAFDRVVQADASGIYTIDRVALGDFLAQPCIGTVDVDEGGRPYADCTLPGSGVAGTLATEGETVTVDLRLPATGTVAGTVTDPATSTPVGDTDIELQNLDHNGPLGRFMTWATADSQGAFQILGVPTGRVRVTARDPAADFSRLGVANGTVSAGTTEPVDVTMGTGVGFTIDLDGTDGFRYGVSCDGSLLRGGASDQSIPDPYWFAYDLDVALSSFPCFDATTPPEDGGREVVIGPSRHAGLDVTRKVFVPVAGGFARYLEILTNPTDQPITVPVRIRGHLSSATANIVAVAPAVTGGTYAVTEDGDGSAPALAYVVGGSGAPVQVETTHFVSGDNEFSYQWSVTVPAQGSAILMHFAVQRQPGDVSGADAQARALVHLTDARALAGMSAEEKAQVVNFNVTN